MKVAWASLASLSLVLGCGAAGGNADKPSNTAGTSSGGSGTSMGGASAGMSAGGNASQSGSSTGGGPTAGSTAGGASGGGAPGGGTSGSGGSAGGTARGFSCPAGPFDMPKLTGYTAVQVEGVPPPDAFNNDNNDFTIIEGDVWIGDALYVSEINPKGERPPSRILKITADDKVSILNPDSGSNGLATNDAGELFGALHKDGSVSKLSLTGGAAVPIATMFMGMPFDSPNDLTIHKNGTIYFTDPNYQAPMPTPQAATRAYRIPPGGMPQAIEELNQPNGITLSKNQDTLYIATAGNLIKKYPVMADGSLGAGTMFAATSADGMVIDCADDLYTASGSVKVFSSAGASLGEIDVPGLGQITNVAFGGADHKTLYVSGEGTGMQKGLFKVAMNLPGLPY